jgi:hypothetical protein
MTVDSLAREFTLRILINHHARTIVFRWLSNPFANSITRGLRAMRDSHRERRNVRGPASRLHPGFAEGSYVVVIDPKIHEKLRTTSLLIERATLLNGQKRRRIRKRYVGIAPAFAVRILNPSICFLISLAKLAAPAPLTTR